MNRRDFIKLAAGAGVGTLVAALPWTIRAETARLPLVGYLSNGDSAGPESTGTAWFLDGMSRLGYVEGHNYARVSRYSERGHDERLPSLAKELVDQKPDVILATATGCAVAARRATSVIPIVGAHMIDPVGFGLAASEARPGGNVTGMLEEPPDLASKQLEFVLDVIPGAASVGLLHHVTNPGGARDRAELQKSAAALGLKCVVGEVHSEGDLEETIAGLTRQRIAAVIIISSTLFFIQRDRIASLALVERLPTFFGFREAAEAGALVGYGVDLAACFRRAAVFVDKILKGTKPSDLPIEFPTTLSMAVNLRTAKALGITIPPTLLVRADEVIE